MVSSKHPLALEKVVICECVAPQLLAMGFEKYVHISSLLLSLKCSRIECFCKGLGGACQNSHL